MPQVSPTSAKQAPSAPDAPANLFAGTSGWAYTSWKPGFYPQNVPARSFLSYYASQLNSVEVNYTFRSVPTPDQLKGWLAVTPATFRFSFKAPQRITHMRRLRDCEDAVKEFLASLAPVRKAGKLGVLLFQLPPNFKADPTRLRDFLALPSLRGKTAPKLAFEFRHESWFTDETYAILRERNVALCIAESDDLTTPEVHTAGHRCYRLRASGGYTSAQLNRFAARFVETSQQHETYVYFKHEDEPTGALNATALLHRAAQLALTPQKEAAA